MGTPTKKRTSGQRKRRASHFALTTKTILRCPKCKKEILPHRVCNFCGYYKGRKVLDRGPVAKKASKSSTG